MRYWVLSIFVFGVLTFHSSHTNAQSYEIRGTLREWIKVFTQKPNELDLLESRLKLEILSSLGEKTAFRAINYFSFDGAKREGKWELKEAYIDYYSDILDVRFGKQVIAWGKADQINPTDILNPQDLSNITEDKSIRKIGLFALKADFKLYDYVLEGIWKPEFDYMRFPSLGSRWAFFDVLGVNELPEPTLPENKFKNTEFALKFSRTGAMFDFSISYFNGWDNIFTPQFTFDPKTNKIKLQKLVFHRAQMFGADFATSIGSVGFWAEGAYLLTEDKDGVENSIKNPYFQYVIGADYTFGWNIKVNIQYFQEVITKINDDIERKKEEKIISKLGIGIPLKKATTFHIEKRFGEWKTHRLELFTFYDLENQGILLGPKVSFSPENAVNFEIGTTIFEGKDESLFGRFKHNDQIYIKCSYSF